MHIGIDSLRPIADWIAATGASESLRQRLWIIPTSQSIHIIAVSVVFASALIVNLRLLRVSRSERPVSVLIGKQAKLLYASLAVLLITGAVQLTAEPVRQLLTPAFWIKMSLILLAVVMTQLLARKVRRDPRHWDLLAARPAWLSIYSVVTIAAWTAVIVCGRFIGYTHQ